jgi:asparagine synthase (glutamine-hydrolysing)
MPTSARPAITLGFEEVCGTAEDEAPLAAKVAECYGARHIMRRDSEREFRADLPAIIEAMDQPSIDGVNTWFRRQGRKGSRP